MDFELPVNEEPDIERECPKCGGIVAVWLKHFDVGDPPGVCSIEGVVHIQGDIEDE